MINQAQKKQLWNLIENIPVAMLTSVDGGIIRSRPMHIIQQEFDGKMWFFTNKQSHKADELHEYPEVNLVFMDVDNGRYMSLSGTATLTSDRQLIERFWAAPASVWFPDGKYSDDVALLEVEIHGAEYWHINKGKITQLLEVMKAKANHRIPELGEHKLYT